jgi:hypothetical protein
LQCTAGRELTSQKPNAVGCRTKVAGLVQAQWAIMESLAQEVNSARNRRDAFDRVRAMLLKLALALDRVLVGCGDEDGRRHLVEGALRLTDTV